MGRDFHQCEKQVFFFLALQNILFCSISNLSPPKKENQKKFTALQSEGRLSEKSPCTLQSGSIQHVRDGSYLDVSL